MNEQVYSWGLGRHGRLGLGDTSDRGTPQLVDTAISALWTPAYLRLVAGRDIVILTESDSNGNKTTV